MMAYTEEQQRESQRIRELRQRLVQAQTRGIVYENALNAIYAVAHIGPVVSGIIQTARRNVELFERA